MFLIRWQLMFDKSIGCHFFCFINTRNLLLSVFCSIFAKK